MYRFIPPGYWFQKMAQLTALEFRRTMSPVQNHLQPQATCGTDPTIGSIDQSPADPQNLYLLIEEIHQLIVYPTFWKVEVLHPGAFNINHHHQPSHPPILRSTPFQVTPGDTNRPDLEGHVCVRSHRYKWLPVSAQKSPRKGRGLNVTVFVQRFQRGFPRGEACERFP